MTGQGPRQAATAPRRPRRRSLPRRGTAHDNFPVVGLGASAGGLDAARRLLAALPLSTGMAFIRIQHLDPTHVSMMVDLLAGHTPMKVQQAADGMPLEREHVYLIPPGAYLSIGSGALRLTEPWERHGARLPFDFFLRSLAEEHGEHAIWVILSGTGGDGSLGLKAIKEKGGLVIVQDPGEAEYDGMPRSAIMTGAADLVLPVAKIPEILAKYGRQLVLNGGRKGQAPDDHAADRLAEFINLLRTKTAHDFALYKPGTLMRRIERRMALAAVDDNGRYLDMLRQGSEELELLAKDLLINVTSFFRDPKAFELALGHLATTGANMLIQDMTREMSVDLLERAHIGRLGCVQGLQPYVVPFSFAYYRKFIYSFSTVGKKIEWMRANPLVCVEADEIVSRHEWQTVVIFGRYQELPDTPEFHRTRAVAHDLLAKTAMWWEPGYVKTLHKGEERRLEPIYFRISINEISGHQGLPAA